LQKQFDSILDFTKLKSTCIFCQQSLRASLTNFVGLRKNGLPVLNVPLAGRRIRFRIKHTTESYDIEADATLDIVSNVVVFTLAQGSEMPYLDQRVASQAFIELKPYFDLHCSNKKCKNGYSLSTYYMLGLTKHSNTASSWSIPTPKLFLENFVTNKYVVQNDWTKETTTIYSRDNENMEPIRVPFMNFEEMGGDKLLNRIPTLVTFS
jgi:hypothetical protein